MILEGKGKEGTTKILFCCNIVFVYDVYVFFFMESYKAILSSSLRQLASHFSRIFYLLAAKEVE